MVQLRKTAGCSSVVSRCALWGASSASQHACACVRSGVRAAEPAPPLPPPPQLPRPLPPTRNLAHDRVVAGADHDAGAVAPHHRGREEGQVGRLHRGNRAFYVRLDDGLAVVSVAVDARPGHGHLQGLGLTCMRGPGWVGGAGPRQERPPCRRPAPPSCCLQAGMWGPLPCRSAGQHARTCQRRVVHLEAVGLNDTQVGGHQVPGGHLQRRARPSAAAPPTNRGCTAECGPAGRAVCRACRRMPAAAAGPAARRRRDRTHPHPAWRGPAAPTCTTSPGTSSQASSTRGVPPRTTLHLRGTMSLKPCIRLCAFSSCRRKGWGGIGGGIGIGVRRARRCALRCTSQGLATGAAYLHVSKGGREHHHHDQHDAQVEVALVRAVEGVGHQAEHAAKEEQQREEVGVRQQVAHPGRQRLHVRRRRSERSVRL
jgi:hypothetical protein